MSYSPEVQARINAKAAATRSGGPSFPMPRLRHNGETGEWLVREVEGDKNAEEVTQFETTKGKWSGVVVRVAFMSQTKYKKDAPSQKITREFTDFKTEPIELLKRTFGTEGKTETVKVFPNYPAFKEATILKDEEGNPSGSAYDLKVCLYVYHFERKQVIKLVCGGSARSEWFEYGRGKPSGDPLVVSVPWKSSHPQAAILEEIVTEFCSAPAKTDKGLEYHRLSFKAARVCTNEEMEEVLETCDKVTEWVNAWKAVNEKFQPEAPATLEQINALANKQPVPMSALYGERKQNTQQDDISMDEIPF